MTRFKCSECGSELNFKTGPTFIEGKIDVNGDIIFDEVESYTKYGFEVSCSEEDSHKIPEEVVNKITDYFYENLNGKIVSMSSEMKEGEKNNG